MKKLIAVLLTSIMMLSVTACGGGGGSAKEDENAGKYITVYAVEESLGITATEEMASLAFTLESGGKGTCEMEGETAKIKWSVEDGVFTTTVEGEEVTGTLENDTLTFDDLFGTGLKVILAKEGTEAANPELYLPEDVKAMLGTWTSTSVVDVLGDDASDEIAPDALSLTINGDNSIDITLAGEQILEGGEWSIWGEEGMVMDDIDESVFWTLSGDTMTVEIAHDDYFYEFTCTK